MFEFWNWSREQWTFAIAIIALVQPPAIALYKRIFKSGTVDIYETGALELGYITFGATIGMTGTLRSRDRDMFIERAYLTLLLPTGGKPRRFDWTFFRTYKTTVGHGGTAYSQIGQSGEVAVDQPASFMISAVQPYRFNILFSDTLLAKQLQPTIQQYSQSLRDYFARPDIAAVVNASGGPGERFGPAAVLNAFHEFTNTREYASALEEYEKHFYWTPGTYRLTFHVETSRPNRRYRESWLFTLQEEEVENLRMNPRTILSELSGVPLLLGQYRFAYPLYEEPRSP